MNFYMHMISLLSCLLIGVISSINAQPLSDPKKVQIILGSTRQGRSSDKIASALQRIATARTDVVLEVVDLRDFALPFLNDEQPPAMRTLITNPIVKKWSSKIQEADAFIVIVPEYNSGYPGVLKNAIDSLYKEWNDKPVALIGYSGGPTGGRSALAQMRAVLRAVKMNVLDQEITIPTAWKAFNADGSLADTTIEKTFNQAIDALIALHK